MKKGLFYAILASVLWAIVNPFIKQGLSYDFSPMNFAGIRFTTVGIILFAYTWHKGMWKEIRQHSKLFLNLILINMFMGYTAFYFGVDFVSGAISSIVMGMTPIINVLLAHLIAKNDKLNIYKVVSLIVSFAGLLLIIGMGNDGEPLDLNRTYTLASHNYWLKSGGDGMSMLMGCPILKDETMVDVDTITSYISEYLGGTVGEEYKDPRGQGRITIK